MTNARRPSTRATSLRLIAASLAAAAAISGGLAVQMAHGHDPALGSGSQSGSTGSPSDGSGGTLGGGVQDQSPPASVVTRAS